jgi:hypothetical protein
MYLKVIQMLFYFQHVNIFIYKIVMSIQISYTKLTERYKNECLKSLNSAFVYVYYFCSSLNNIFRPSSRDASKS